MVICLTPPYYPYYPYHPYYPYFFKKGVGNTLLGLWVVLHIKKVKLIPIVQALPKVADPISRVLF